MANDTTDPDVISTENIGFSRRQDMYCRTGPEEGPPILATVSGPLINTISAIDKPIPSGLEINIKLVRNEDQFIITDLSTSPVKTIYRLRIHKIEILLPTMVLNPRYQVDIDRIWLKNKIRYIFNRIEIESYILPDKVRNWQTNNLFGNKETVPPLFCYWFQNQKRSQGDYRQSCQKFIVPGGKNTLETGPRLENYAFTVDNVNWGNYRSAFQTSTTNGVFQRHYQESLNNLRNYYGDEIPKMYFNDYKDWMFVTWVRTSVLPPNLNYFNMHTVEFPVLRNSLCRLEFEFNEPLDCQDDLLEIYIMGIYPSYMDIDNNRQITTSYYATS